MLLIRQKKKPAPVTRGKIKATSMKKIGAFAYQLFMALAGLGISISIMLSDGASHDIISTIAHQLMVVAEALIVLFAIFGFLFLRSREEH